MADNKDSFGITPGPIALKGKPKGITTFSKKFVMMLYAGGIICLIIVVTATISNWDSTSKGRQEASGTNAVKKLSPGQEAQAPRTVNFDKLYDEAKRNDEAENVPMPVANVKPEAAGLGPAAPVPAISASTQNKTPTVAPAFGTSGGDASFNATGKDEADRALEQRKLQAKSASPAAAGWNNQSGTNTEPSGSQDKLLSALSSLKDAAAGAGQPNQQGMQPEDPNMQVRKENFLKAAAAAPDRSTLLQTAKAPISPFIVTAGTVIPAAMGCSIVTDLPGQICARVTQTVYDKVTGRYALIPQNAEIIGSYDSRVAMGQKRILVVWDRIQFQNGEKLELQGMPGADSSGAAGFDADVDNHYARILTTVSLASLFSAGLQISQTNEGQNNTNSPSVGQTVASTIGQQVAQTGSSIIQKQLSIQPTLSRERGYPFVVQVTKDIVFGGPYRNVLR